MIRKNDNERDKTDQLYTHSNIFEFISAVINIASPLLFTEFANSDYHISFMNIMEKSVLQAH